MNWGNRLLITFIVFGCMICYLVYRSFNTNFELVEKDYYGSEIAYQKVIDGSNMADKLSAPVTVNEDHSVINIQLPAEMKNKLVNGIVWFYCDYDQLRDKTITLHPDSNGLQSIAKTIIQPGQYLLKITWDCEGKSYYTEKKLVIN
jgi:hypothetical protein